MYYDEESRYVDHEYYSDIIRFSKTLKSNEQQKNKNNLIPWLESLLEQYWKVLEVPNSILKDAIRDIPKEDMEKIISYLMKDREKFKYCDLLFDIPELLKFGLEIETKELKPTKVELLYEYGLFPTIMSSLEIPEDIINSICNNIDFNRKNEGYKWTISKESYDDTEISTPIMTNSLENVNRISAICILLKALGAELNGGTGLHINIGVDYLECNVQALWNFLKIWGECEELFFKVANPEGEVIRIAASSFAVPIADNIQHFMNEDGSITLENDDDKETFIYNIQAYNRLERILSFNQDLKLPSMKHISELDNFDEEKRRQVFHEYQQEIKNRPFRDDETRWTSVNYNHMEWNADEPGRIEIRIFNSSLEIETILEDLFLVAKAFEVSLKNAKNPNYKAKEFQSLFRRDVTEKQKLDRMLNLLFASDEHKEIYARRWESVHGKREYRFTHSKEPTFIRE